MACSVPKPFQDYLPPLSETIQSHPQLSFVERNTYLLIRNLTHKKGFCFASNTYLSKQRGGCSIRTIQRHLKKLKQLNLLKIVVLNHNRRRIYLTDQEKPSTPTSKPVPYPTSSPCSNDGGWDDQMSPQSDKMSYIRESKRRFIYKKQLKKDQEPATAASCKNILEESHPIWKGRTEQEFNLVKELFFKRNKNKKIFKPERWIRECLKQGWHKEAAPSFFSSPLTSDNACKEKESQAKPKDPQLPEEPWRINARKNRIFCEVIRRKSAKILGEELKIKIDHPSSRGLIHVKGNFLWLDFPGECTPHEEFTSSILKTLKTHEYPVERLGL